MPLPKEVFFHRLDLREISKQIDAWIDDDGTKFGGGKIPSKIERRSEAFYGEAAHNIREKVIKHNESHEKVVGKEKAIRNLNKLLTEVSESKNPITIQRTEKINKLLLEIMKEKREFENKIEDTDKVLPDEFRGHGAFKPNTKFVEVPTNGEDPI